MEVTHEDSHSSFYCFSTSTLCEKYYLKAIINETGSVRFFKIVTWHCLQSASLGNVILIICLLFQSLWGWRHTLTVRGIVQQETCAVTASFSGKYNIRFWRSSFLSCGLLWTEHILFRTTVFQKVSLADLFCLLHDHLQVHMIFKFSLRVLLKDHFYVWLKGSWTGRENSWRLVLFYWEKVGFAPPDSCHRMGHSVTTEQSLSPPEQTLAELQVMRPISSSGLRFLAALKAIFWTQMHIWGYEGRCTLVGKWPCHIRAAQPTADSEEDEFILILN